MAASPGPIIRSSSTANSSLLSRATVSQPRVARCRRAATSRSSASPWAWPSESFDGGEVVEVDVDHGDPVGRTTRRPSCAPAGPARERVAQPVEEERAVGQARERVVERLVRERGPEGDLRVDRRRQVLERGHVGVAPRARLAVDRAQTADHLAFGGDRHAQVRHHAPVTPVTVRPVGDAVRADERVPARVRHHGAARARRPRAG
jgi:hypothetical protein